MLDPMRLGLAAGIVWGIGYVPHDIAGYVHKRRRSLGHINDRHVPRIRSNVSRSRH
jgi:hypothetical protein